jgi:hypothetical protein
MPQIIVKFKIDKSISDIKMELIKKHGIVRWSDVHEALAEVLPPGASLTEEELLEIDESMFNNTLDSIIEEGEKNSIKINDIFSESTKPISVKEFGIFELGSKSSVTGCNHLISFMIGRTQINIVFAEFVDNGKFNIHFTKHDKRRCYQPIFIGREYIERDDDIFAFAEKGDWRNMMDCPNMERMMFDGGDYVNTEAREDHIRRITERGKTIYKEEMRTTPTQFLNDAVIKMTKGFLFTSTLESLAGPSDFNEGLEQGRII